MRPNLRWTDACKIDMTRSGVERRQHNKQDIMEEEANQQLYRRPPDDGPKPGKKKSERSVCPSKSWFAMSSNRRSPKVTSPQARPSICEGLPISNTDVSLPKVSEIVMPIYIYNVSKCLVYDK